MKTHPARSNVAASRAAGRRRQSYAKTKRTRRIFFEALEERRLLATFTVNSALDNTISDQFVTLREAIDMANANNNLSETDVIEFDTSLMGQDILLEQGDLFIDESVEINGLGPDQLSIDGQALTRVIRILQTADDADVSISGLTIKNGRSFVSDGGAGILFEGSGTLTISNSVVTANEMTDPLAQGAGINASVSGNVVISNSEITNNKAPRDGGGVRVDTGSLTITDSIVSGNEAGTLGGGIFSRSGSGNISLLRTTVTNNTAESGAGIASTGANVQLNESTISLNTASETGGGIHSTRDVTIFGGSNVINNVAATGGGIRIDGTNTLGVSDSTISGNSASSTGGGIASAGSTFINFSSIQDNTAGFGGGIASSGTMKAFSSTISGNTATRGGGGINSSGTATIDNSTISGNDATGASGGGIINYAVPNAPAMLTVTGSTIANNTADSATGLHTFGAGSPVASLTNTIVAGTVTKAGTLTGSRNLFTDSETNVGIVGGNNRFEIDPQLGPLADNGGSTQTHALLAVDPVHAYPLDDSLADTMGGPSLVALGGTFSGGGYDFGPNEGLNLLSANVSPGEYAIELSFSFDALSGFQKIIDFKDLSVDTGLYSFGDDLRFFGAIASAANVLEAGVTHHLLLTRNDDTEEVRAVLDGTEVWRFVDSDQQAVFSGDSQIIRFFQDDFGNEAQSGFVDRINVFDSPPNPAIDAGGTELVLDDYSTNKFPASYEFVKIDILPTGAQNQPQVAGGKAQLNVGLGVGGFIWRGGESLRAGDTVSVDIDFNYPIEGPDFTSALGLGLFTDGGELLADLSVNTLQSGPTDSVFNDDVTSTPLVGTPSGPLNLSVTATQSTLTSGGAATISVEYTLSGDGIESISSSQTFDVFELFFGPTAFNVVDNQGVHDDLTYTPAINAFTDQRDDPFVRVFDGDGNGTAQLDIGAYELQTIDPSLFVVTTLTDELDYSNNDVSLREAINSANGNPGADAITFATGLSGTIDLDHGELLIGDAVSIAGPGAQLLTIDAGGDSRILNVDDGDGSSMTTVSLEGLTLTGGDASGPGNMAQGGAILNREELSVHQTTIANSSAELNGGGIFNSGDLVVTESTVQDNAADFGGGITNFGAATIIRSTLSGNTATSNGAALDNVDALTVTNSTISGNTSSNGNSINNYAFPSTTATVTVSNSTIADNTATMDNSIGSFGPGVSVVQISNSIVTGTVFGSLTGSNNLFVDSQVDITGNNNVIDEPAMLGPLGDNGGPNHTRSLLAGSPGIDAGDNALVPTGTVFDQRGSGFLRIADGDLDGTATVDIGAFELQRVNQQPTFTASNPPAVPEDSGAQTVTDFATFDPGDSSESSQTVLAYAVSGITNAALFSVAPAIDTSGTLTYTPASGVSGTSDFMVVVQDNGGTAGGGVDTSVAQTFTISVVTEDPNEILDVTGNGNSNPFQDGILIVRFMLGQPDANLEDPALIPAGSTRTTGAAIRAHLEAAGNALDANGDGVVNPFQDGVLIVRFLLGQPDANLEDPVLIPAGSTRTTGAAIRAHLQTLLPAASGGEFVPQASGEDESILGTPVRSADVNGDGRVTARDALNVINQVDRGRVDDEIWSRLDANQDRKLTAADAFYVINRLDEGGVVQAGAESVEGDSMDAVDKVFSDKLFVPELF